MQNFHCYKDEIEMIAGKTIAVVYIFEGETSAGADHYAIWQADVISDWIKAIQEIRCMPLILDVRTFVNKVMNKTLPHIDYVVNLNNGTKSLSALGLVPSACAFLGVPCIPCNSSTALIGENKYISNIIARSLGLNVPRDLPASCVDGMNRPTNFGSSIGVIKGKKSNQSGLFQEFIPGFDMTTPLLYDPLRGCLDVLPPVMYYPDNRDPQWFLGAKEKETHDQYQKRIVQVDQNVQEHFKKLAINSGITSFCRIDCRVKCRSGEEIDALSNEIIPFERVYFVEINPMPTIKEGINFFTSLQGITSDSPFYESVCFYNEIVKNHSLTGYVLTCAIQSITKH